MKETFDHLKQHMVEAKDVAKIQWKSFSVAMLIILSIYFASNLIGPGWISYTISFPAFLIIALTALARVNDIGVEKMSGRWQVRRVGLILAGAGAVMFMGSPFTAYGFPTWKSVAISWGFALAWLTTPEMPPWEDYITGRYRTKEYPPGRARSPLNRILRMTGEHKAFRRGDGEGP